MVSQHFASEESVSDHRDGSMSDAAAATSSATEDTASVPVSLMSTATNTL